MCITMYSWMENEDRDKKKLNTNDIFNVSHYNFHSLLIFTPFYWINSISLVVFAGVVVDEADASALLLLLLGLFISCRINSIISDVIRANKCKMVNEKYPHNLYHYEQLECIVKSALMHLN